MWAQIVSHPKVDVLVVRLPSREDSWVQLVREGQGEIYYWYRENAIHQILAETIQEWIQRRY